MSISKSTLFVFVLVVIVMTLSVTVFRVGRGAGVGKQDSRPSNSKQFQDRTDRFPTVHDDEPEPTDTIKRAKLKKQKERYDKDAPFVHPRPHHTEIAFRPEWQFDFPGLPVAKSDVIVIGQVLNAEAHRSNNKLNVFSNFEIRVDQILKGSRLTAGSVINVQRIGGFVIYPNGQRVLFRLVGTGMPAVQGRYVFFLNVIDDEDYSILTGYELGVEGVVPLDNSPQFQIYQRQTETEFVKALRDVISQAVPQRE